MTLRTKITIVKILIEMRQTTLNEPKFNIKLVSLGTLKIQANKVQKNCQFNSFLKGPICMLGEGTVLKRFGYRFIDIDC